MSAAIAIQGVSKTYHVRKGKWLRRTHSAFEALKKVDLSIEPGEFFGLLGPNGAGKTTLISILAGLTKPTAGHASICGYDVQSQATFARRALGVVPQELVFDPFFTVRETLRLQSGYFGLHQNDDWIDNVLHHLGLSDKADTNMRALSGGMKRRVMVAQALVHQPPVILLDEPTAGVDVDLRRTLWDFIRQLNQKGHTIVLTTHYLEEAQELCGRIGMMHQGELVALDSTQTLLHSISGNQVQLRLAHAAPNLFAHEIAGVRLQEQRDDVFVFALELPEQLEALLAHIRLQGAQLLDIEIHKADLEQVFVEIIQQAKQRVSQA